MGRRSSQSYESDEDQPQGEPSAADAEAVGEVSRPVSLSADDVEGFIQTLAAHPLFQGLVDDTVMKIMVEMQGSGAGFLEELRNMIRAEIAAAVPPPPPESGAEPADTTSYEQEQL